VTLRLEMRGLEKTRNPRMMLTLTLQTITLKTLACKLQTHTLQHRH
jgi:hypothetical protein